MACVALKGDAIGTPADLGRLAQQVGFTKAVELFFVFVLGAAVLVVLFKGPEWLKVILEHRRLVREAADNEKGRQFERLRDLHRMIADRTSSALRDARDDP